MRNIFPLFMVLTTVAQAQQVQWLTADPIAYEINPDMPTHLVCASDVDHSYIARSTTLSYQYGTVFGGAEVEQRNAIGAINWSFTLGDTVLLQAMASDLAGNVILGGQFFRQVHLNGEAVLSALNGNEFPESFLIALDVNGNLLWQRNISPADPQGTQLQSITFDPQGRAWYATCDFFNAEIKRLDDAGNDVETRTIQDAKSIGNISFDPWGGLYFSGAAEFPGITVGGTFYPVPGSYNMVVGRYTPDGTPQWLQAAADVTFQRPRVKADAFGHAYFAGSPFDNLNFDGIPFHGPEWNTTFFLARIDSMGNFVWGYQPPLGAPFTGQFGFGKNESLGVDGQGNAVVIGVTNGVVNWGNNVETNIGTIQERAVTMLQIDSTGTPQWELHGGSMDYDVPEGISVLPDGVCHIAVQVRDTFFLGPFSVDVSTSHVVMARIDPGVATGIAAVIPGSHELAVFPSPYTDHFNVAGTFFTNSPITVRVFDGCGRMVLESVDVTQLGGELAPGIYQVEVRQPGHVWHGRVVKQ